MSEDPKLEDLENGLEELVRKSGTIKGLDDEELGLLEKTRQLGIEKLKDAVELIKKLPDDEEFVRTMARDIVSQGRIILGILQSSLESDPDNKAMFAIPSLMNSMSELLKNLSNTVLEKEKISLVKTNRVNQTQLAGKNVVLIGSVNDVMRMLEEKKEAIEAEFSEVPAGAEA